MRAVLLPAVLAVLALLVGCSGSEPPELSGRSMAVIPAGSFSMGHALATPGPYGSEWKENELPPHEVSLSAYRIDRSEVTASDWAAFLQPASHAQVHHHPLQPVEWSGM